MFFGKKKITQVADAIAPLQQIVNDLQEVSNHQQEQVERAELLIEKMTSRKKTSQREADLATSQITKMNKVFGINPE